MPRLIDADKLIELCNIMADKCDGIGKSIWGQFATTVEWSPTVDAELVKHGQWVHNKWSNMRHDYSCSLCGCRIEGVDPFSLSATTYNYCPECGAKMDEVRDE